MIRAGSETRAYDHQSNKIAWYQRNHTYILLKICWKWDTMSFWQQKIYHFLFTWSRKSKINVGLTFHWFGCIFYFFTVAAWKEHEDFLTIIQKDNYFLAIEIWSCSFHAANFNFLIVSVKIADMSRFPVDRQCSKRDNSKSIANCDGKYRMWKVQTFVS